MVRKRRWTIRRVIYTLQGTSAVMLSMISLVVLTGLFSESATDVIRLRTPRKDAVGGRGPASIEPVLEAAADEVDLQSILLLTLDCQSKMVIPSSSGNIRLKGVSCNGKTIKKLAVENATTDVAATVFESGPSFTTDLIQLKTGTNVIDVRFEYDDGTTETVIKTVEFQ